MTQHFVSHSVASVGHPQSTSSPAIVSRGALPIPRGERISLTSLLNADNTDSIPASFSFTNLLDPLAPSLNRSCNHWNNFRCVLVSVVVPRQPPLCLAQLPLCLLVFESETDMRLETYSPSSLALAASTQASL